MADFPLNLPISVQDKGATKQLNAIRASTQGLEKSFTKLSGAFQNAFQFYVRFRIFGLINQGISAIENAIPGLIARGQEWADTVDAVADATGLAAGRASQLAAVAQIMTGNAEGLNRALGALANTTANHADVLRRYGIETRNSNGQMLDSWHILMNVRRAISDLGNGFLATAAARELFSRGGQSLLDMLTMSDRAFRLLSRDVRQSGVIMTDAGLRAAEAWQRTQQRFEMSITGIANVIVQTVQPMLTRLVDGITNYLRQNMTAIVGFVTRVIGFVVGALAGFFGIDLDVKALAESLDSLAGKKGQAETALGRGARRRSEQTKGEDAYTKAIQRQIDAIDRQLEAMSRADRKRAAREEQQRLLQEIADAQRELEDIRSKSIFAAGMSAREAELARQQQAADEADALKRIADARKRMQEQNRRTALEERRFELEQRQAALQEQLAAHMKAAQKRQSLEREAMGQVLSGASTGLKDLPKNLREAFRVGKQEFLTAIEKAQPIGRDLGVKLGEFTATLQKLWDTVSANLPHWIDSLNTVAAAIGKVGDGIANVIKWLDEHNPFGTGPGQTNLGLKPEDIVVGGAAAFLFRRQIAAAIRMGLGLLLPSAGAAVRNSAVGTAGAAAARAGGSAAGGAAGAIARFFGPAGMALFAKELAETVTPTIEGPAGRVIEGMEQRGNAAFDRLVEGAQKSLQDAGNALFGPGTAVGDFLGTKPPTPEETSAAIGSGVVAGFGMLDAENAGIRAIGTAMRGGVDPLLKPLQDTAERQQQLRNTMNLTRFNLQSGGRNVASWSQEAVLLMRQLFSREGGLVGVANVNLYLDERLLMGVSGIPLTRGNSTLRPNRNS